MNITEARIDTLKETINIGVGQAAAVLSDMVGDTVELRVPEVKIFTDATSYLKDGEDGVMATVIQQFSGILSGSAILAFRPESALRLVAKVLGEEPGAQQLDAERESTLTEVGNILLNGVMGAFGNLGEIELIFELPTYREASNRDLLESESYSDGPILLIKVEFSLLKSKIMGEVLIFFSANRTDELMTFLDVLFNAGSEQK